MVASATCGMFPCSPALAPAARALPVALGRCGAVTLWRAERVSQRRPYTRSRIVRAESVLQNGSVDAVLVLAGGQMDDGSPPPWGVRRLDKAYDVYHALGRSCSLLCLGGGTPHKKPSLLPTGFVYHEGTSYADYLLWEKHVPPEDIFKEASSYDTVGNAYFSLTIHAIPAIWRNLVVVTSEFHMPRTKVLFQDMYKLAGQSLYNDPERFQLSFESASDEGLFSEDVYGARKEKEASSVQSWIKTRARLHNLRDLHNWLHQEHLCYSVRRQHEFGQPTNLTPELAGSY